MAAVSSRADRLADLRARWTRRRLATGRRRSLRDAPGTLPGRDRRARPRGAAAPRRRATRPGSGAPPPTTWRSTGSAAPTTTMDVSARRRVGDLVGRRRVQLRRRRRSIGAPARDPDGSALVWEGEDGEVRTLTNARAADGGGPGGGDARAHWRRAGDRVGHPAADARRRRSWRCSRWASCRPSSRPSSRATAPRPSRRRLARLRGVAAHHRRRLPPSRRGRAAQGDRRRGRGHGADRARGARASGARRSGAGADATTPGRALDAGRDHWWHEALAAPGARAAPRDADRPTRRRPT